MNVMPPTRTTMSEGAAASSPPAAASAHRAAGRTPARLLFRLRRFILSALPKSVWSILCGAERQYVS